MSDGSNRPTTSGGGSNSNDVVETIWQRVIGQVNRLTAAHEAFGFVHFTANLNPTLPDIVTAFGFVDFVLVAFEKSGQLSPEESLRVNNARQCILKIKGLSLALDADDQAEYEKIMVELTNQAP